MDYGVPDQNVTVYGEDKPQYEEYDEGKFYSVENIDHSAWNTWKQNMQMEQLQTTMLMHHKLRESILNQTDVSLSLAKHVIFTEAKDSNLVFSPLSLHLLLALMAAGSTSTGDQLSSYMVTHVLADGSPLGGPRLSCANGVWVDRSFPLEPSFQEIVKNAYKAVVTTVDFQCKAEEVREEVNRWAEKETKGLIKEILPPGSVDALTRFILGNAMYFKGVWNEKFDSSVTKDDEFFLLNGNKVRAPFMTSWKQQYIRAFDSFKVLSLPYRQGRDDMRRFSMYIFLPDAKDGLPALLEKFSSESSFIEHHLPYELVKVGDFRIPKFKIDFGFEASKVLEQQGLLPPLVDSKGGQNLYVSSIFHKSFIEVNEEGTEAAAVSVGVAMGCSRVWREVKLVDFVADHPFLFVIREDMTGAVLFVGQVLNPIAD